MEGDIGWCKLNNEQMMKGKMIKRFLFQVDAIISSKHVIYSHVLLFFVCFLLMTHEKKQYASPKSNYITQVKSTVYACFTFHIWSTSASLVSSSIN